MPSVAYPSLSIVFASAFTIKTATFASKFTISATKFNDVDVGGRTAIVR